MYYIVTFDYNKKNLSDFWNLFWQFCEYERIRATGIYTTITKKKKQIIKIHTKVDRAILEESLRLITLKGFLEKSNGKIETFKKVTSSKLNEVVLINYGGIKIDLSHKIILESIFNNTELSLANIAKIKKPKKRRVKILILLGVVATVTMAIFVFANSSEAQKTDNRKLKGKKFVHAKASFGKKVQNNSGSGDVNEDDFDHDELEELLKRRDIIAKRFENNNTFLHLAIINGRKDLVKEIIKKEIDINAVNDFKDTALHIAVSLEQKNIVKILLNNNANKKIKNEKGYTPMDIAQKTNNFAIIKIMQ